MPQCHAVSEFSSHVKSENTAADGTISTHTADPATNSLALPTANSDGNSEIGIKLSSKALADAGSPFERGSSGVGGASPVTGGCGAPPAAEPPLLARNRLGQTAMHAAALGGCADCCAQLLAADARAGAVLDKRGDTPAQLARRRGNEVRDSPVSIPAQLVYLHTHYTLHRVYLHSRYTAIVLGSVHTCTHVLLLSR